MPARLHARTRALTDLLAAVDDVLGKRQSADARSADDRVVAGRRVGHLHGAELEERLAEDDATEDQLPAAGRGEG